MLTTDSGRLESQPLLSKPLHVATSSPWLYPFKGMYCFMTHSFLWPVLRARSLPCFILSLAVYTFLFLVAYLPQVAFFAIFYGRALAWVNAAFLVLGEGAAIVALLFEAFFVDESLADIFDAVLIHEGLEDLVARGRDIIPDGVDPVKKLGKSRISHVYSPFSFRQICEFIVLLPLTLAPVIGTPLFLIFTGYRAGPLQHWRYFKLLGLTKAEQKQAIKRRQRKYTWFGTVHLALQLIPGLSMLFLLTTAAGSAMWAAKIEKKRRLEAEIAHSIAVGLSRGRINGGT
ncbi:uncharacterized protein C8Q71DRAFT_283236 [Rhodofomes roseus]|uniref:Uncharacterized protein n=1 Tax=Rhodofomes roseus TaxID=34475 RepID=A0ABQ8K4W1_9APHY|nr:uncharacterized protein C8Q71DRAFT_283236 [Rhodofomes roseus]KAH9831753.1 hypothetical protein C8Q71DRAFT_283236 [Rhodofomes roseus]